MKLASYVVDGRLGFGVVTGDGVVTLSGRTKYAGLRDVLTAGELDEIRRVAEGQRVDHKISDLRFLPAIPEPEKILCAGINYRSHAAETGRDIPKSPSMFVRFVDTLVGHDGEMIRPTVSECFDFEGELAIVIGRAGRHIKPERALEHVAGYTCFVDGSVRDFQKISVTSGKNFPAPGRSARGSSPPTRFRSGAAHPRDAAQRPGGAAPGTDLLIHSVPEIIAFCSDSRRCPGRRDRHRHAGRRRPSPHRRCG